MISGKSRDNADDDIIAAAIRCTLGEFEEMGVTNAPEKESSSDIAVETMESDRTAFSRVCDRLINTYSNSGQLLDLDSGNIRKDVQEKIYKMTENVRNDTAPEDIIHIADAVKDEFLGGSDSETT